MRWTTCPACRRRVTLNTPPPGMSPGLLLLHWPTGSKVCHWDTTGTPWGCHGEDTAPMSEAQPLHVSVSWSGISWAPTSRGPQGSGPPGSARHPLREQDSSLRALASVSSPALRLQIQWKGGCFRYPQPLPGHPRGSGQQLPTSTHSSGVVDGGRVP